MYAEINTQKYAVDDVSTESGVVSITFPDTPMEDIAALAQNPAHEVSVFTDAGTAIFSFQGYTVPTKIEYLPAKGQTRLTLRQPYESEKNYGSLQADVDELNEALNMILTGYTGEEETDETGTEG